MRLLLSCFMFTKAPFMTTPLIAWLPVGWFVNAYEFKVAVVKMAIRSDKIIKLLVKIKAIGIRTRMI